ncbi:MAG: anti-sigma factor [Chloroflexi bacterium]|nr:anti-sigma factor [Chloroflexota bacterium]
MPYALAAAFAALAIGLGVWGGARGGGADVQTYVTRDTNGAQARVVALPENGLVVVTVTNLPQLEAGRVYQAWAVRGATPESLGTFNTDASGSASMAMQAVLHSGETLAFTVEPAGGSLAPTTAPFLATRF